MDKNYEVRIEEVIYSNNYKLTKKILNLLIKVMSIIVIVGSFTGDVATVVDRLCIENKLGMGTLMYIIIVFGSLFYLMHYVFMSMVNKPIKILIRDICLCYITVLVGFNYGIYYQETNEINIVYLFAVYLTLYLSKKLIDIISEYKLWHSIYEDAVELYGDKYKEYQKVNSVLNEEFAEKDKLNICLNKFNFEEDNSVKYIVKLEIRLKKYFISKTKKTSK